MPTSESYAFLARQPGAVDSAFAVLEAVNQLGPGVTARELTNALPMSRASIYRILKHLVAQEYLVRTPDLRGFVIGERIRALGRAPLEPANPLTSAPVEASQLDQQIVNGPGTAR